jgi:hypothetical protein
MSQPSTAHGRVTGERGTAVARGADGPIPGVHRGCRSGSQSRVTGFSLKEPLGFEGRLRSDCSRWTAAAVFTLPAIEPSFGPPAGADLDDGSTRYYGRSNPLRRSASRRRPLLLRSTSQYRPTPHAHRPEPVVTKQTVASQSRDSRKPMARLLDELDAWREPHEHQLQADVMTERAC